MDHRDPLRLRHADAALDRSGVGVRRAGARSSRTSPRRCWRSTLRARASSVAAGVDLVAQRERIDAEPLGELVDRLLEREDALHLAGRAERRARPGVGEDVVLLCGHVRTGIHHRVREADARAARDAAGAVALELRSPSACRRASAPIFSRWRLLGRLPTDDVLLAAIEHHAHRRAGLARQVDRQQPEVADAVLRAEPAAGEIADDAHLALRQVRTSRPPRRARWS